MSSISKYIFRQTAFVMIFVTVVLSFVIWLTQSLRFVDMVVNRGLPITEFLWLAMLSTPQMVTLILPLACVIATVYVYNRLIADRELIVLRAAGLSSFQLSRPALRLAIITALLTYLMNFYVLPASFREFADLRYSINSDYSSVLIQEGTFITTPQKFTIFVRKIGGAGILQGILVYDGRDPDKPVTYMAHEGRLIGTDNGPRLVLIDGISQFANRKDSSISFLQFEKQSVDLNVASGTAPVGRKRKPEEMYLWQLFDPSLAKDKYYGQVIGKYRAEGHSRIVSPLLAVGLVLMSLAILLSGDFSRRGQGRRILVVALFVVLLYSSGFAAINIVSDDLRLVPLLYANVAVPILVGLFMLGPGGQRRRVRGPKSAFEAGLSDAAGG